MNNKGQVSVEYVMLFGFLMVILLPLMVFFYKYSLDTNDQVISQQIDQVAKKIVDNVDAVYYLGEPSQTVLKIYLPGQVKNATLARNELVFTINTRSGLNEIVQISKVNMTGTLSHSQGIHYLTIKATGQSVHISTK